MAVPAWGQASLFYLKGLAMAINDNGEEFIYMHEIGMKFLERGYRVDDAKNDLESALEACDPNEALLSAILFELKKINSSREGERRMKHNEEFMKDFESWWEMMILEHGKPPQGLRKHDLKRVVGRLKYGHNYNSDEYNIKYMYRNWRNFFDIIRNWNFYSSSKIIDKIKKWEKQ